MKSVKCLVLSIIIVQLMGCSSEKPPSQIYDEYNMKVIDGISFEEDQSYFSKRKQNEVESKFPQYMKQMGKSRDQVIELYLKFSREVAKCKDITLSSEVIDANTAMLEYSQQDICGNDSPSQEKQKIKMINEDGWKIDDIEMSL